MKEVKKKTMIGAATLQRSELKIASEILTVCAFLHHLDGPIGFAGGAMKDDGDLVDARELAHGTVEEEELLKARDHCQAGGRDSEDETVDDCMAGYVTAEDDNDQEDHSG